MITIIVPCYNEEETIPLFFAAVEAQKQVMNTTFEYIFINDGSKDKTLQVIQTLSSYLKFVQFFYPFH